MREREISYSESERQKQVVGLKGKVTKRLTQEPEFLIHSAMETVNM